MTYVWHEAEQHRAALAALRALGEAVATVARARLVSRVADGQTVRVFLDDRDLELWQHGHELCLSEYQHQRSPRRLHTFAGYSDDVAAEAVARLIEEVGRE